jgi:thiosulfate dehydrogenase (quinone) large subunit
MLATLPLRLFFGATFLYAGLDKLLDPSFLDPSAVGSLHAQLIAFARFSPLGSLITASLPFSVPIGLLIAVAEIGIGIGALTGLAFRVAALGGMVLSLLFWLSASWATHPYYFGADLPYAVGWLALVIAGHGGAFVPGRFTGTVPDASPLRTASTAPEPPRPDVPPSPERRLVLQTVTLAAVAAVVASLTLPLRATGLLAGGSGSGGGPTPGPTPSPFPTPAATVPPGSVAVASVADVASAGALAFTIPFDAPAPLPGGDPAVIVQLADGTFAAFDATCTHAACAVEWDAADRLLVCPCHQATFDPEGGAAVLGGPAPAPLTNLPIAIDPVTGTILLVPST